MCSSPPFFSPIIPLLLAPTFAINLRRRLLSRPQHIITRQRHNTSLPQRTNATRAIQTALATITVLRRRCRSRPLGIGVPTSTHLRGTGAPENQQLCPVACQALNLRGRWNQVPYHPVLRAARRVSIRARVQHASQVDARLPILLGRHQSSPHPHHLSRISPQSRFQRSLHPHLLARISPRSHTVPRSTERIIVTYLIQGKM
mmetsp:Transcript_5308/g.11542  ORF Transcript_5308/g.11542 Transcript_5308/m.11542 type:complete len:202 (-) Transcript_5308:523-1128(-)